MASQSFENQAAWKQVSRMAWIRVGALGDLLVGLASLCEMPTFFPNARVTVIGPKQFVEILSPSCFPFIERLAVVEKGKMTARVLVPEGAVWAANGQTEVPIMTILATCGACVNTNIDSLRYGFAALRAGVPIRVGSVAIPMTWIYTHNSPYFGKDPLVHERDAALLIPELATAKFKRHFQLTRWNRQSLSEILASSALVKKWREHGLPQAKHPNNQLPKIVTGQASGTYLLVNPTASRREKAWPAERMHEFIRAIGPEIARTGIVPIVIGAPSETEWLSEVAGQEFAIVQPKNLAELQDIVSGARALVTNASSMQFIAAMTKTPTLTIIGRANPLIWGPVGRHDRYIKGTIGQLPKGVDVSDQFKNEECRFQAITVIEVVKELRTLLLATNNGVTPGFGVEAN